MASAAARIVFQFPSVRSRSQITNSIRSLVICCSASLAPAQRIIFHALRKKAFQITVIFNAGTDKQNGNIFGQGKLRW